MEIQSEKTCRIFVKKYLFKEYLLIDELITLTFESNLDI